MRTLFSARLPTSPDGSCAAPAALPQHLRHHSAVCGGGGRLPCLQVRSLQLQSACNSLDLVTWRVSNSIHESTSHRWDDLGRRHVTEGWLVTATLGAGAKVTHFLSSSCKSDIFYFGWHSIVNSRNLRWIKWLSVYLLSQNTGDFWGHVNRFY